MKIKLKYRNWLDADPPQPIKLQIPGWAGEQGHENGDKPQPWHCPPFVEAATYGLELIYPFSEVCSVSRYEDGLKFDGKFPETPNGTIPFSNFAPDHYGFTSSIDVNTPDDFIVRTEPHPRFYVDTTGTCPIAVTGHIQNWWSRIFFIAFKAPRIGETHIFRPGEPYAQLLILPKKIQYEIEEMSEEEREERSKREAIIANIGHKHIAKNRWKDHKGGAFDDKYKVLSSIYAKDGLAGVDAALANAQKKSSPRTRFQSKPFLKHETKDHPKQS